MVLLEYISGNLHSYAIRTLLWLGNDKIEIVHDIFFSSLVQLHSRDDP